MQEKQTRVTYEILSARKNKVFPSCLTEDQIDLWCSRKVKKFTISVLWSWIRLEPMEWRDGMEGEMVYTAIDRECTPLIRYRTRGRAKVWTEKCGC
jgi:hypothetical protein